MYVDPGSLVAIGTRPLHAAQFGSPRKPSYVDAATRFTNRPSYEPVRKGQRLRLATSHCGFRRVADRVTFLGRAPAATPYRSSGAGAGGGLDLAGWQVVLLLLGTGAAGLMAVLWRRMGRP